MITWIQNALFVRKHHLTFKEIVKIQKIMGWNAIGTFLIIFEKCKLNIGNTSVEEFNFLTGKIYPDIKMLRFNTSWFIMNVYIRKTSNQHLKDYPCITAKKKKNSLFIYYCKCAFSKSICSFKNSEPKGSILCNELHVV